MFKKRLFLKNIKSEIEKDKDYGKYWVIHELIAVYHNLKSNNDGLSPVTGTETDILRLKQIVWWLEDNDD